MNKSRIVRKGLSTTSILGLIFVTLKLTGYITWNWAWVTLPFWGGWATIILGIIFFFILIGILSLFNK